MKPPILSRRQALLLVAAFTPFLQSCSSLPTTLALYGVKALMSVKHSNESAYGYYQLGKYLQERNHLDAAVAAYENALSVEPNHLEARNALGVVSSLQNKLDVAVEHFRSALSLSPRSAHVHNNLGHAYYLQGKYTEAISALESASGLDPRNHTTLRNLGLAYQAAGSVQKAEEAFAKAAATRMRHASSDEVVKEQIRTAGAPVRSSPLPDDLARDLASKGSSAATVELRKEVAARSEGIDGVRRHNNADTTVLLIDSNVYELRVTTPVQQPLAQPAVPATAIAPSSSANRRVARLEISNANAVPGLARAVGDQLKRAGFNVVRVTNEVPYRRRSTELQFRDGYTDDATWLAATFQSKVSVAPAQALRSDVQLRLVLGQDVVTSAALLKPETVHGAREKTHVAQR